MTRYFAKGYDAFRSPKADEVVMATVENETDPITLYNPSGGGKRLKNLNLSYLLAGVHQGSWYECTREEAHPLCSRTPQVMDEPETTGDAW